MTSFLSNLGRETNLALTENGAVTNRSSQDPVVDFFGLAGAMRNDPEKAADLFEKAYKTEPLTAVRTLFYLRDVRGGQGEREVFRAGLRRLTKYDTYAKVVEHVPYYGRWDDIFHSGVTSEVVKAVGEQFGVDRHAYDSGGSVSLMAKWLPSENASSKKTKDTASQLRTALGVTPRQYRLALTALRRRIRLLEQDMSANNWNGIDYSRLPSQAHRRHVKAFHRHTPERYQAYLAAVERGEQTMNVKTLYPYEIYEMVMGGQRDYGELAWKSLPDYTNGKNALVMADVSGSMTWASNPKPISVSVSLALYFAERNNGPFQDYFMTFSANPQLIKVTGDSLYEKMRLISQSEWGQNTNLLSAFRAIQKAGAKSPEEIPEVLYIISDMEFDAAAPQGGQYTMQQQLIHTPFGMRVENRRVLLPGTSRDTIFETAKREYAQAGMKLPHVVFWNVNARQNQAPALAHDGNATLVSGCSSTIFSQAVEGKTPRQLVDEVVNSERYARITF